MSTTTPILGLTAPTVGDTTDTWANQLNNDMLLIDPLGATIAPTAANLIWASPASGTGSPSFRALTSADLPGGGGLNGASVKSADYTITSADNGKLLVLNAGAPRTFTLPNPPPSPSFSLFIENVCPSTLTIARSSCLIDTAAVNLTLAQNQGVMISTDGVNYWTERGMGVVGAFVPTTRQILTSVPLTGGGDLSADRTLSVSTMTGDSGSGGARGVVPAPAAGDTAAGKFLKADGTWAVPSGGAAASGSLVIGYDIGSGSTGTNVGPMLVAPASGTLSRCLVVTKASDSATGLTFTINKNGTSVFSASPNLAAGTASGTVSAFTNLTSVPLNVVTNDVFSLDVTAGTTSWQFSAQLVT